MPPCLTLSIIRYGSRVKWSNPGKGVAPSPTPWCSSYRKGSLRVTLDYGRQLYLEKLFWCDVNRLSRQFVCFFSFLFRCGKPQITWFIISFFLFYFNFFLSLTITTKNVRYLTFHSFFFLSFFFSLKITTKTSEISPFFLSFFLSFFPFLKSACCYDCWLDSLSAFFSLLFRCGKLQITWFVLSFFLFSLIFSFFKDYNKKTSQISSSILSLFFSWIFCVQTLTECYPCVLYY